MTAVAQPIAANTVEPTIILLNEDSRPWAIECQPYPADWCNPQRWEAWAGAGHLKRVAREMRTQGIGGRDKYRLATWAGYTHREAVTIAGMAKR